MSFRGGRNDLNGVEKENLMSLGFGLERWSNWLTGEAEEVMTCWRVYGMRS